MNQNLKIEETPNDPLIDHNKILWSINESHLIDYRHPIPGSSCRPWSGARREPPLRSGAVPSLHGAIRFRAGRDGHSLARRRGVEPWLPGCHCRARCRSSCESPQGEAMFDHPGVVFRDLRIAGALYRAVLEPLGIKLMEDHGGADGTGWLVFSTGEPESPFYVVAGGRQKQRRSRRETRPLRLRLTDRSGGNNVEASVYADARAGEACFTGGLVSTNLKQAFSLKGRLTGGGCRARGDLAQHSVGMRRGAGRANHQRALRPSTLSPRPGKGTFPLMRAPTADGP